MKTSPSHHNIRKYPLRPFFSRIFPSCPWKGRAEGLKNKQGFGPCKIKKLGYIK
jgi:hypothetical protein